MQGQYKFFSETMIVYHPNTLIYILCKDIFLHSHQMKKLALVQILLSLNSDRLSWGILFNHLGHLFNKLLIYLNANI